MGIKSTTAFRALNLLLLPLLSGCSDDTEKTYTDSTGTEFVRLCAGDDCEFQLSGASECGPDASIIGGRWLLACTAMSDAVYFANCRPVICATAADCEYFRGGMPYSCVDGLCKNESWGDEWGLADVTGYCLRSIDRGTYCKSDPGDQLPAPQSDWVLRECGSMGMTCANLPPECR